MRYFLLSLFFILTINTTIFSQAPQFNQVNFTIEDGLPSNECHDILQDSTGYIWIATDRGLVRYDGYEFKTYGVPEGLTDISCLDIEFDQEQNIWINTLSGRIFIYDQKMDRIHLYEHQAIIDSFLVCSRLKDLAVSKDNKLALVMLSIGFLIIDNKSGDFILKRAEDKEGSIEFTLTIDERQLISNDTRGQHLEYLECLEKVYSHSINNWYCQYYIDHNSKRYQGIFSDVSNSLSSDRLAFKIAPDIMYIYTSGTSYFFSEDQLVSYRADNQYYLDLLSYSEGSFFAGMHNRGGLKYYLTLKDFQLDHASSIIENVSISRILKDNNGDLWCTSLEKGIYYLKNEEITTNSFPELSTSNIKNIETGENELYCLEEKQKLYKISNNEIVLVLNEKQKELKSIKYSYSYNGIIVSSNSTELLSGPNHDSYELKLIAYDNEISLYSNSFFEFDPDEIFFSTSSALIAKTHLDSAQVYHSYDDQNMRIRVIAVEKVAKDDFLLGTTKGLKKYGNKTITDIEDYPTELQLRINSIKKINEWYAFGTQGNGLVFWDLQDSVFTIQQQDGLISNNIESIFKSDEEQLYLSTKSGLSKVWFDEQQQVRVKNYTTFHGLPSNEVNDVDQLGDTIYIATGKGIATLVEDPAPSSLHQPFFTNIQINETIYQADSIPSSLHYKENNIRIAFKTIDFKMQGAIPYRYLLNDNDWQNTSATEINYPSLPPGNYTFRLQSKNIDDAWSTPITLDFEIRLPWWRTSWFWVLCGLLMFFCAGYYSKFRTDQLKKEVAIENEMRELERAALQAQMNPHFIFNCLNSIQNFIMANDKENAMEYLVKFAKLIRQSLNFSTTSKIPLDQEISMLSNYIDLEQLRFKNKFNYHIVVSSELTPEEIKIPTLLIQPFVENAIIHGLKDIQKDGLIEVLFIKNDETSIRAIIRDNGNGLAKSNKLNGHKSLGMSITSKRIAHNNNVIDGSYSITPEHTSSGTEIDIVIQL